MVPLINLNPATAGPVAGGGPAGSKLGCADVTERLMAEFDTRLSPALVTAVVLRQRLLLVERRGVVDPSELEHQARLALQVVLDLRASRAGGTVSRQSVAVATWGER